MVDRSNLAFLATGELGFFAILSWFCSVRGYAVRRGGGDCERDGGGGATCGVGLDESPVLAATRFGGMFSLL